MRNRWFTPTAVKLHLIAIVVIGACLALGWWQLQRALGGHMQSWAYTIEWPLFAGYGGWMWWKLLHEEPEFGGRQRSAEPEPEESDVVGAEHGASE